MILLHLCTCILGRPDYIVLHFIHLQYKCFLILDNKLDTKDRQEVTSSFFLFSEISSPYTFSIPFVTGCVALIIADY